MAYDILIVDDSASMRSVIKRTLNMTDIECGYIFEAGNGREALDVLGREKIDLVLADINMPELNGIELIRIMRTENPIIAVPVVIISTEASQSRIQEFQHYGSIGYIHKPFTPEAIKHEIENVLGGYHVENP